MFRFSELNMIKIPILREVEYRTVKVLFAGVLDAQLNQLTGNHSYQVAQLFSYFHSYC